MNEFDVNVYNSVHFTLMLLLH